MKKEHARDRSSNDIGQCYKLISISPSRVTILHNRISKDKNSKCSSHQYSLKKNQQHNQSFHHRRGEDSYPKEKERKESSKKKGEEKLFLSSGETSESYLQ